MRERKKEIEYSWWQGIGDIRVQVLAKAARTCPEAALPCPSEDLSQHVIGTWLVSGGADLHKADLQCSLPPAAQATRSMNLLPRSTA